MYKFYHNPRCRKSRETLAILKEKVSDDKIDIIFYLETPPTESELKKIISHLKIPAEKLIRKNEDEFKQFKGKKLSDDEWIAIMCKNPKLIERPLVVKGESVIIGRPPENVNSLI